MVELDERACENCKWWKRLGDGETGICLSVVDNDYASTDIVYQTGADKGAMFITYESFSCRDYQAAESDPG